VSAGWGLSEFTEVAESRVHAAALGPDGAPEVVCVHGLGCSHRYFLPLAQQLAAHLRVVAVDLPGFGQTPGPPAALDIRGLSLALADWLRATRRARVPLIANSAGCQVVVDLATHSPELLGPIVLVGATVDRRARSHPQQLWRLICDVPFENPALVPLLARDYLTCGPRRFLATFQHMLADRIEEKLRLIRVPAAVVRGKRDPIAPAAWARELAARLPAGRYVEVAGAGHAVNFSSPVKLARITRALLEDRMPDEDGA